MFNAVLIGAQKAGTTSLFDWLLQHPEVNGLMYYKDLGVFSSNSEFDLDQVIKDHKKSGGHKPVQLHACVNYLHDKDVAKRLHSHNPDMHIILSVRNPVLRAYSAFQFYKKRALEPLSFSERFYQDKNGKIVDAKELKNLTYYSQGRYSAHLKRYLKYFDKEQIKIVFFEDMMQEKHNILNEIYDFLNIPNFDEISFNHKNITGKVKSKFLSKMLFKDNKFKRALSPVTDALMGSEFKRALRLKLEQLNTSKIKDAPITSELYNEFIKYYEEEFRFLEDFTGKKVEEIWPKDYSEYQNKKHN